jgi:hypothetical protein
MKPCVYPEKAQIRQNRETGLLTVKKIRQGKSYPAGSLDGLG